MRLLTANILELTNSAAAAGERKWAVRINDDGSFELGTVTDSGFFQASGMRSRRAGTSVSHQECSTQFGTSELAPSVFATATATSGGSYLLNVAAFPLLVDEDGAGVAVAEGETYVFDITLDITVTGGYKGFARGSLVAWRPAGGSIVYDAATFIPDTLLGAGTQIDWNNATFTFTDLNNVPSLEIDWDLSGPSAYEARAAVTVKHTRTAHPPEI